jgi:hypothetical protein
MIFPNMLIVSLPKKLEDCADPKRAYRVGFSVRSVQRLAASLQLANASTSTSPTSFFGMTVADDITMSHLLHPSAVNGITQMRSNSGSHAALQPPQKFTEP